MYLSAPAEAGDNTLGQVRFHVLQIVISPNLLPRTKVRRQLADSISQ